MGREAGQLLYNFPFSCPAEPGVDSWAETSVTYTTGLRNPSAECSSSWNSGTHRTLRYGSVVLMGSGGSQEPGSLIRKNIILIGETPSVAKISQFGMTALLLNFSSRNVY